VASGIAFHVGTDDDPADCPAGAVLVTQRPVAGLGEIVPRIRALVGGKLNVTGDAISVAREFGVPVVLGAKGAYELIPQGMEVTVDAHAGRIYQGRVPQLAALYRSHESLAKDSPGRRTLRRVADLIVPLHLANAESDAFSPESCESLHDIMHLAHELAYKEMFRISDIVSDTSGAGAVKLRAAVLLDLRIIDLGGGLQGTHTYSRSATLDQVTSAPLRAVLNGMLHEDVRYQGPRPINVEGFLSVMKEQMLAPNEMASRFGERSYALVSDTYLNFSSRIGYHYIVLDAHAGENASKNHISFTFKGGAADDVRRNRRARAIGAIFEAFDFSVEVQADRVKAHFHQHERPLIEARLEMIGRLLQFSRQMDMLTQCEESVEVLAKSFLKKNYSLEGERICEIPAS
jgi:pyruvate,water dikinase